MIDVVFDETLYNYLLSCSNSYVFLFEDDLSFGNINRNNFVQSRIEFYVKNELLSYSKLDRLKKQYKLLEKLLVRSDLDKKIRFWVNNQIPRDLCNMFFMTNRFLEKKSKVSTYNFFEVSLPRYLWKDENEVYCYSGWGEISDEDLSSIINTTKYENQIPRTLITHYGYSFRSLQENNSPLRVIVNGKLIGRNEDFYDDTILSAINTSKDLILDNIVADIIFDEESHVKVNDVWCRNRVLKLLENK